MPWIRSRLEGVRYLEGAVLRHRHITTIPIDQIPSPESKTRCDNPQWLGSALLLIFTRSTDAIAVRSSRRTRRNRKSQADACSEPCPSRVEILRSEQRTKFCIPGLSIHCDRLPKSGSLTDGSAPSTNDARGSPIFAHPSFDPWPVNFSS